MNASSKRCSIFARAIQFFFRTDAEGAAPMRTLLADAAVALSEGEAFAVFERTIAASMQRYLREALGPRSNGIDVELEAQFMLVTDRA